MLSDDWLSGFRGALGAISHRPGLESFRRYRNPEGAFDAALNLNSANNDDVERCRQILALLEQKLDLDEFDQVIAVLGEVPAFAACLEADAEDSDLGQRDVESQPLRIFDQPIPFKGRPRVGGGMDRRQIAVDAKLTRLDRERESYERMFPMAKRIRQAY
jgi:hypothetical protein